MSGFARLALVVCTACVLAGCPVDTCHHNDDCIDGYLCSQEQDCVEADPLAIADQPLPDAVVDQDYQITMYAQGGLDPYQWAIVRDETDASWISIDADSGLLSGSPTFLEADMKVTVRVTDNSYGDGLTISRQYTLNSECAAGHHEDQGMCIQDQLCLANTCSGHGTCNDSSGVVVCTCYQGHAGDYCETCAAGYHDESGTCVADETCNAGSCSGHGRCVDSTGVVTCTCDDGYTGQHCDECAAGYHEEELECVPNRTCLPSSCSFHGTCDDSTGALVCTCDLGFEGDNCETCIGVHCSLEWVALQAGVFDMGSDDLPGSSPVHQVTIEDFSILRTEVTISQYQECVSAGECSEPGDTSVDSYCNWGQSGREVHPVNCVDWFQACDFCARIGGRLPTEAEWEYAARSEGQDVTYPWGEDALSCDFAVVYDFDQDIHGCGEDSTWPVCSKPAGNTQQGLCDMTGNVFEWCRDWYHETYEGAPADGSAWEDPASTDRVIRGLCFFHPVFFVHCAEVSGRCLGRPAVQSFIQGFRCVRKISP